MKDYHLLYKRIVLAAWHVDYQFKDPFKLGNAGVFNNVNNDLSKEDGHNIKLSLSAAIKKVAAENIDTRPPIHTLQIQLDKNLSQSGSYNDLC